MRNVSWYRLAASNVIRTEWAKGPIARQRWARTFVIDSWRNWLLTWKTLVFVDIKCSRESYPEKPGFKLPWTKCYNSLTRPAPPHMTFLSFSFFQKMPSSKDRENPLTSLVNVLAAGVLLFTKLKFETFKANPGDDKPKRDPWGKEEKNGMESEAGTPPRQGDCKVCAIRTSQGREWALSLRTKKARRDATSYLFASLEIS